MKIKNESKLGAAVKVAGVGFVEFGEIVEVDDQLAERLLAGGCFVAAGSAQSPTKGGAKKKAAAKRNTNTNDTEKEGS